jgi:hypothetical protein
LNGEWGSGSPRRSASQARSSAQRPTGQTGGQTQVCLHNRRERVPGLPDGLPALASGLHVSATRRIVISARSAAAIAALRSSGAMPFTVHGLIRASASSSNTPSGSPTVSLIGLTHASRSPTASRLSPTTARTSPTKGRNSPTVWQNSQTEHVFSRTGRETSPTLTRLSLPPLLACRSKGGCSPCSALPCAWLCSPRKGGAFDLHSDRRHLNRRRRDGKRRLFSSANRKHVVVSPASPG